MNALAPMGTVFVCSCCGKRSHDKYGTVRADPGWDESCIMHSVLCSEENITLSERGRVIKAFAVDIQPLELPINE